MAISVPQNLKCEYLVNPLGIDTPSPRFSWQANHNERGQAQSAYQIIVSSEIGLLHKETGDHWDSGKVDSEQSFNLPYNGKALSSNRLYYWSVRWWDKNGNRSPFSDVATFVMGLMEVSDWKARWITPKKHQSFTSQGSVLLGEQMEGYHGTFGIYLRKTIRLKEKPARAMAFVCGLGFYELYINGRKIGNRVLDPAQTDYGKLALYSSYDVSGFLDKKNAVGLILGNGRHIKNYGYNAPKAILQIHITHKNGDEEIVITDTSWKTAHAISWMY